ncbi:MAG: 4-hydroxy-tetrahydrodipicolinate reductase [Synergistaceae bacterium]|nr:4-hydroxy-tetrahydrodipicolinate reductase [Synergistaceae bacterium]
MKIIINGAGGKMGHMLADMAGSENVAALVDVAFETADGKYHALDDFTGNADCVIDFSNHAATKAVTSYCVKRNLPVLIASTGQTDDETAIIREASKHIPVFISPNMSVGVALVADIAERVARLFGDCDIEMIEAHHNQKLDVPSGTALMLANRIMDARNDPSVLRTPPLTQERQEDNAPLDKGERATQWRGGYLNIGRHENGKRSPSEIGIHSLRYGSEVGTHEIIFSNGLETITIRHDAKNRALFARGALSAAKWLVNKKPGLYGMSDYISEA